MSEFTPAQLDAVEDALEDLESVGIPATLLESADPGDQEAVMRLGRFRDLLALSRDAFPLEEVPAGLLDGVIAQARASTQADVVASVPPAAEPTQTPWWKRLKAVFLIPGLAVAGTAALILFVIVPAKDAEEAATPTTVAQAERVEADKDAPAAAADRRLADASVEKNESDEADPFDLEPPRAGGAIAEPEPAAVEDPEMDDPSRGRIRRDEGPTRARGAAEESDDDKILYEERKPSTSATKSDQNQKNPLGGSSDPPPPAKKSKAKPAAPKPSAPDPEPTPVPGAAGGKGSGSPKTEGPSDAPDPWTVLAKADSLRKGGKCSLARARYRDVDDSPDPRARARAFAGLGLCDEIEGNKASAESLYARARSLDPGVASFIAAQRPAPQQKAAPKSAPPPADVSEQTGE